MRSRGLYGQRLGDIFSLKTAPAFATRTLRKTEIAVTDIRCDGENNGLTKPIPREDALLVTLQLRDCPRYDLWLDDKPVTTGPLEAGVTCFYDLRRTFETIADNRSRDKDGVKAIMGHAPASGDMTATYRQEFEDERLRSIVNHVRDWLYPPQTAAQAG